MADAESIRELFFLKGMSISAIAEKTGHDRKTIRKYLRKDDWNREVSAAVSKASKLDPYKPLIDEWLEADRRTRKKQRHTARRVFSRLVEQAGRTRFPAPTAPWPPTWPRKSGASTAGGNPRPACRWTTRRGRPRWTSARRSTWRPGAEPGRLRECRLSVQQRRLPAAVRRRNGRVPPGGAEGDLRAHRRGAAEDLVGQRLQHGRPHPEGRRAGAHRLVCPLQGALRL